MRKAIPFFIAIFSIFMTYNVNGQSTIDVSLGTSQEHTAPFNNYYKNSWTECIYTPQELGSMAMTITKIGWYCATSAQSLSCSSIKIYMGHRSTDTHASDSDWTPASALTLVYSTSAATTIGGVDGWQEFALSSSFAYNGQSNLVVVVCKTADSYNSSLKWYHESSSTSRCLYRRNDSDASYANHPGSNTGSSAMRPNIRLTGTINASTSLPSQSFYKYGYSQQIFFPADLGVSEKSKITSISFYNAGTTKTRNYDVYMQNTTKSSFSSATDYVATTGSALFSGEVTMNANEWTTINLTTPFVYDGSQNLLITMDDNTGSYSSGMSCAIVSKSSYRSIYGYDDNINYTPSSPNALNNKGYMQSVNAIRFGVELMGTPVPISHGFENSRDKWTLSNESQTNQWYIGTASKKDGSYGLYITNDGGTSNAYTLSSASSVYAYRTISFDHTGTYRFSFDWKSVGESNYDYLRAFLAPISATLTAGSDNGINGTSVPSGWIDISQGGGYMSEQSDWQHSEKDLTVAAGAYRLVFYWRNDVSITHGVPATVDNIAITPIYNLACGESVTFYDSGGASGDYDNYEDGTYIFQQTENHPLTITFSSFAAESYTSNWDYMILYNGTASETQIAKLGGSGGSISGNITSATSYQANSGMLTAVWHSDGSNVRAGWAATVSAPNPSTGTISGSDKSICAGESTSLGASISGSSGTLSYAWSPSTGLSSSTELNPTASPTSTTTYTLTVTANLNGCIATATKSVTVTVNPVPTPSISGTASICGGSSTTLTASGGSTYSWSPATGLNTTSGASVTASPTASTLYTVTATSSAGCTASSSTTVTVTTPSPITILPEETACLAAGSSITLSATSESGSFSEDFNSTTAASGASITEDTYMPAGWATWKNGGTYYAGVSSSTNYVPAGSGQTLRMAATSGYMVYAAVPNPFTSTANVTVSFKYVYENASIGILKVGYVSGGQTGTFTELETLPAVAGSWQDYSNSFTFPANTYLAFQWSQSLGTWYSVAIDDVSYSLPPTGALTWAKVSGQDGTASGSDYTVSNLAAGGSNSYRATLVNGPCTTTATKTVTVIPDLTISGTTAVCEGGSTTLTASGGSSYEWSTGTTGATLSLTDITSSDTYTVTTTKNGCTATKSVMVLPISGIELTSTPAATECLDYGSALTLNCAPTTPVTCETYAFAAANGAWSEITDGEILADLTNQDDGSTTVTLPFTFEYCGTDYTSLYVCTNGYMMFGSGLQTTGNNLNASTYAPAIAPYWDDLKASNIQTKTLGSIPNRVFVVQFYCYSFYDASTMIYFQVRLHETTNKIEFVYGPGFPDVTSAEASIGINDKAGGSVHFQSVTPASSAGATTVSTTTANNSIGIAQCGYLTPGLTYTFTPTLNSTYAWNSGESSSSITVPVTSDRTYRVTYTLGSCTRTQEKSVTVKPAASILASGTEYCTGDSPVSLTAVPAGYSYQWSSNAGGSTSQSVSVTPISRTTYSVTASTAVGCTASASQTVDIPPMVSGLSITTNPADVSCLEIGQPVTLTGTLDGPSKASDYTVSGGQTAYSGITGTTVLSSTKDDYYYTIPIGFDFTYCGTAYTNVVMTTNGVMQFGSSLSNSIYGNDLDSEDNVLAPFWDDLESVSIIYNLSGTAGSRVLTIQCSSFVHNDNEGNLFNYQIKLYENGNRIRFHYGDGFSRIAYSSTSASIGISHSDLDDTDFISLTPVAAAPYHNSSRTIDNNSINANTAHLLTSGIYYDFTPGTPAFAWSWPTSGSAYTQSINTNAAGKTEYTVTCTRQGFCPASESVEVIAPHPGALSISSNTAICKGESATLTATLGADYRGDRYYEWSTGETTLSITVTPDVTTTYTFTASATIDDCTKSVTKSVTVTVNENPQIAITPVSGTACPRRDQTVQATITPGSGSFSASSITWTGCDGTKSLSGNVAANSIYTSTNCNTTLPYSATITDDNGCSASDNGSITVLDNEAPTISAGYTTIYNVSGSNCSFTIPDVSASVRAHAFDICTENADLIITQSPPPGFAITRQAAQQDIPFTVSVSDLCGNSTPVTGIHLIVPPALTADIASTDNVNCNGGSDGSITLSHSGGRSGYTYAWSKDGAAYASTKDLANIPAGTYSVTVTDADGCTATASAAITQPSAPLAFSTEVTDVKCHGESNGAITVTAQNGTPDYSYAIDGGAYQSGNLFSSLAAGTYSISVKDANGCVKSQNVEIVEPLLLTITSITTTQESCTGHDGTATATASGGTTPYAYLWSNGDSRHNPDTLTSLANSGIYTLTVTDHNGCSATGSATITLNNPLDLNDIDFGSICSGKEFYIAPQNGVDGTIPDNTSYSWSFDDIPAGLALGDGYSASTSNATGIRGMFVNSTSAPITYTFEVTPQNGVCSGNASHAEVEIGVSVVPPVSIAVPELVDVCPNAGSTTINATIEGGATDLHKIIWEIDGMAVQTDNHTSASQNSSSYTFSIPSTPCSKDYTYNVIYRDSSQCDANDGGTIRVRIPDWSIGTADGTATVQCVGDAEAIAEANLPAVTDGCSNTLSAVLHETVENVNATTQEGSITYVYRYTACDETYRDWRFTYTIHRTTPPAVASGFSNGTTMACYADAAEPTSVPTATDVCNVEISPSEPEVLTTGTQCDGTKTYRYTYTDRARLENTWEYTYTIKDESAPAVAGYTTEYDAVVSNCTFTYPDVTGDIRSHSTDNCTLREALVIGQSPDAGTAIALTSVAQSLPITVTVKDACGRTTTISDIFVNAPAELEATITADQTICSGESATIEVSASKGTAPYLYNWSPNASETAASATVQPTTSTDYSVTVTDANGCQKIATISVTVNSPAIELQDIADEAICAGGTGITIAAIPTASNGDVTYAWSPADGLSATTGQSVTANPTTTTTYTVTATAIIGECSVSASKSVVVTVNAPNAGTVALAGAEICAGETATLTPSVEGSTGTLGYAWSDGSTAATLSVTEAGTYIVTVTANVNGCLATASQSATVTVNALPEAQIAGESAICKGKQAVLTASGGDDYVWSTGHGIAEITVSPTATTTYRVTVTNATTNCSATAEHEVAVNANPTAAISGTTEICAGASTTLTATGGVSYAWDNGTSAAANEVAPTATTTYTVTVTDGNGCKDIAEQEVVVRAPAVELPDLAPLAICAGGEGVLLKAIPTASNGDVTYAWSPADGLSATTGQSVTANPTSTTTYTVTATATIGECSASASASASVAVNAPAVGTISLTDQTICEGSAASLDATPTTSNGDISYLWSNGATTATIAPTTASDYAVTVTATIGECSASASASASVTVNAPAVGTISLTDQTICEGSAASLDATPATANGELSYLWSNGATTATIAPTTAGNYAVTVTATIGECSASATASATVTVNAPAVGTISLTNQTICEGSAASLDATPATANGNLSYLWSNGATTATIAPTTAGNYTVTVTATIGECSASASASVSVTVNAPAVGIISLTDQTICEGSAASLDATPATANGDLSYLWSNGATTATIAPTTAGNYAVTVTATIGECSASATASATVTVNAPAVGTISLADQTICEGSAASLDAVITNSNGTLNYRWSTGDENSSITVTPSSTDTYTLYVTATVGTCTVTGSQSATVTVHTLPVIPAISGNDAPSCGQAGVAYSITDMGASYSYLWSADNGTVASGSTSNAATIDFASITNGIISVVVTNTATGCSATQTKEVTLVGCDNGIISDLAATAICAGSELAIGAHVNGTLTSDMTVAFDFDDATITNTEIAAAAMVSQSVTYITAGTRTVTIQLKRGSTVLADCQTTVTVNANPAVAIAAIAGEVCPRGTQTVTAYITDGSVAVAASNITWSSNVTNTTYAGNMAAGEISTGSNCNTDIAYSVSITDANGCKASDNSTLIVKDNTAPTVSTGYQTQYNAVAAGTCRFKYPDVTASVRAHASDGCPGTLTITQSPVAGAIIPATSAGQNLAVTVTVKDPCNNTTTVSDIKVQMPTALDVEIVSAGTHCYGVDDGSMVVAVSGATPNYTLVWNGSTGSTGSHTLTAAGNDVISNIPDGSYTVTVTDANGCTKTVSTDIEQINTDLVITADDATKVYDGTPLTAPSYTVTFGAESYHVEAPATSAILTTSHGDVVTATITGSITDMGTEANVVGTVTVMRGTEDVTCEYHIVREDGELEVLENGAYSVICPSGSSIVKTYNGTPLAPTASTSVTEGTTIYYSTDGRATWTETAPSITDVGNLTVDVWAHNDNYTDRYCAYTLKVLARPVTLTANSITTITYDGLEHTYLETAGDHYTLTSGTLVAGHEITDITVTGAGTNAGSHATTIAAGSVRIMNGADDVTANYTVSRVAGSIRINPASLTITVNDQKRVDGDTLITHYTNTAAMTASGLVAGDYLTAGSVMTTDVTEGRYTYADHTSSVRDEFATFKGIGNYNLNIVATQFIVDSDCPPAISLVLQYGACDTTYTEDLVAPTLTGGMAGTLSHDPVPAHLQGGTTTPIRWYVTNDVTHVTTELCTQLIYVDFPPCGTAMDSATDGAGNRYSSVRIGCTCWLGENLRTTQYATPAPAPTPSPAPMRAGATRAANEPVGTYYTYNESDSLGQIYGLLYSWYSTMRVTEGDDAAEPVITYRGRVRGICPDGWAVPTNEEYILMVAVSGDSWQTKAASTDYWVSGQEGHLPGSGFNALGAGSYMPTTSHYESLKTAARFWTTGVSAVQPQYATFVEIGACESEECIEAAKNEGHSVRCVRVQ